MPVCLATGEAEGAVHPARGSAFAVEPPGFLVDQLFCICPLLSMTSTVNSLTPPGSNLALCGL